MSHGIMEFHRQFTIDGKTIGPGCPVYIVAEISANHGQKYEDAVSLIHAAAGIGVDAVKIQTYTPDTLTIDCDSPAFTLQSGSLWESRTLYEIYKQGMMPWEWQPRLKTLAESLGLTLFSTPYDTTAVDFLEGLKVPAYKISSFELIDLPLIQKVAQTGKPVILSTGMATHAEIKEALSVIHRADGREAALLKCTSGYPTPPSDMNLSTIVRMMSDFMIPCGLSDHCLDSAPAVAAVALGACIIEKHLTLSRNRDTLDKGFSLEPAMFKSLVEQIRIAEKALGTACYGPSPAESESLRFRRSLYVVKDLCTGDPVTPDSIRSIRPSGGLPPKYRSQVEGKRVTRDLKKGTPLTWDALE